MSPFMARVRLLTCACVFAASVTAKADDAAPPNAPQTTSASPTPEASPAPAPPSRVKVFVISPEESEQTFMCDSGRIQSVLATAIAEHRIVSIVLLDQTKAAIPEGVWASAYGFRLAHKQNVKINAIVFCGN